MIASVQWTGDPLDPRPDVGGFRGGSGTPLLLLHPALLSWRVWRPVLGRLTGHHDVIAPSLTGHRGGPPRTPGTPLSISMIVDNVERELDALGIDTAHLAGNSLGGRVCLELLRRGRARSVVAFSPPGTWAKDGDGRRVLYMLKLVQRVAAVPGLVQTLRPSHTRRAVLLPGMQHGERVRLADLVDMFRDLHYAEIMNEIHADVRATGVMSPLETGGVPVRVAWAEHDRVTPYQRFGVPLHSLISGGEFLVLPGVGHIPMWDAPELVADTILDVTAKVDAADTPPAPLGTTDQEAS